MAAPVPLDPPTVIPVLHHYAMFEPEAICLELYPPMMAEEPRTKIRLLAPPTVIDNVSTHPTGDVAMVEFTLTRAQAQFLGEYLITRVGWGDLLRIPQRLDELIAKHGIARQPGNGKLDAISERIEELEAQLAAMQAPSMLVEAR